VDCDTYKIPELSMILPLERRPCKPGGLKANFAGLFKFAQRRYGLLDRFGVVDDGREGLRTKIPLGAILLAFTAGLCLGIGSMRGIDDRLRHSPSFRRLVGRSGWNRPFCDDTMREGLTRLDWRDLRAVVHQQGLRELLRWGAFRYRDCALARRLAEVGQSRLAAKAVVAIDGHELFCGRGHGGCADCKVRWKEIKRGKNLTEWVCEFYHQVTVAHWIGTHPALVLDFEPVGPGESEWTAGARLVERLHDVYEDRIGILVADAFYDHEPFRACARKAGYDTVVRHKDKRRQPGGDCKARLDKRDPRRERPLVRFTGVGGRKYEVWEEEESPAGRRYIEVYCPEDPRAGGGCVTNIPKSAAHAAAIGIIMESRWWIENACFHEIAKPWHLDRAFVHKGRPTAVWAIVALVFIAFNLWQTYVYRELRLPPERPPRTHGDLRFDLWETLGQMPRARENAQWPMPP
jgi:hypothetical protein